MLRGYSGYNTRWALKVMDEALGGVAAADAPPLAVTVFFRANDASIPDRSSGFQHVPVEDYQSDLRIICSTIKAGQISLPSHPIRL